MNACYRALVALSAVIPLSIPFVYIFAESLIANIPRSVVDALGKLFKTPIFERWGKQFCLN